jgi:hypothetical protein
MDKKAKKRIEVLRQRQAKLQQLISAAKQQLDDPAELAAFEKEFAANVAELSKLKDS